MEDTKVLDLKKAIFYYFMSWRVTILCIILSVALLLGYTYIKPVVKQSTDPQEDPEQMEKILLEKKNKFIAENADAKGWNAQIIASEKEIELLEYQLSNNLFLQIDPDKRINKSFDLKFSYFMIDFKDEAEEIRTNQMLSLHYMRQLSGDRYINYLASNGIIKYKPDNVANLVDVRINEEGQIAFEVTGPEEIIIDQFIKTTKEYLEKIIRPEIDLLAAHFLHFTDIKKEVVRDPSIVLLKNKIENEIILKKGEVEELTKSIDEAFEEALKEEAEKEGNKNPVGATAPRSYKRNLILGVFLGFILSVIIALIRFRHNIVAINVQQIALANGIPHLGTLIYREGVENVRKKRFGNSIDNLFIKMFGMSYDEAKAAQSAEYAAQILIGVVEGLHDRDLEVESEISYTCDTLSSGNVYEIFIPNVEKSETLKANVQKLQEFLNKSKDEQTNCIHLIAGGSLENDPNAVDYARESKGLLLISDTISRNNELFTSLRRSKDICKDVLGILELKEQF